MKTKLVAGNWKMHGARDMVASLVPSIVADAPQGVDVALCVPYPYLAQVGALVEGTSVALGAQDVSEEEQGAFTGEVSGAMLAEFGCRFAIVGHSERRARHGESSARVAAKAARAIACGLTPIVCVGETLEQREAGATLSVIADQLAPVLELGAAALGRLVLAYEPVWAIGTGRTASVEQAVEVHRAMRNALRDRAPEAAEGVRLLYGGSVKPDSASTLFAGEDIDGGLIGGASLDAEAFLAICRAAA